MASNWLALSILKYLPALILLISRDGEDDWRYDVDGVTVEASVIVGWQDSEP
eukprot:CAMPEP_0204438616 /NCGR_PEP_ID=MMETSP0470-20130426/79763_1 /ASSEMBLY_ACC=CAM_ASM_000385 /TAXON_ID=2969 /ORGANISM="Oxyrrhis marina" /LENGTH=51 /DNA_ID=CAMNT_0051437459 /DNA_START=31 /DNA_END=186 /DNA_ORIENTATION=+